MCKYRWLKRGQWDLSFKKGIRLGLDRGRTPWPDRGCSLVVLRLRLEPLQLPEWVQILSHNCRFAFCAASGRVDFSQALLRYLFTSCGSELRNIDYPSFWRLKWGFLRLHFDSCIFAFLWCHGAQLWVPSEWLIGFLILLLLVHWTPSEHDSHDWDFIRDSVASLPSLEMEKDESSGALNRHVGVACGFDDSTMESVLDNGLPVEPLISSASMSHVISKTLAEQASLSGLKLPWEQGK